MWSDNRHEFTVEGSEDRWQSLKEELMDCDDDEIVPISGDLVLPKMSLKKTKAFKRDQRVCPSKIEKVKQKTLGQSLTDKDMEELMNKYRKQDHEEDEAAVDITKYLQEDDVDDDIETAEAALNADVFFSTLIGPAKQMQSAASLAHDEECIHVNAPLIRINDEELQFDSPSFTREKLEKDKTLGVNYLEAVPPIEKVEVLGSLVRRPSENHSNTLKGDLNTATGLFYWFDIKEQSYSLSVDPGTLFIFGRIHFETNGNSQFRSCCVRVQNMYRCIYLLPYPTSSEEDVVKEVNNLCRRNGIEQRRIKFVERYYAFEELGIPHEKTTWVKLRYSGRYPALRTNEKYQHIKAIMGASTSLLELFILKRKLKGPSFLQISDLKLSTNRTTHCAVEYTVDSPKKISVCESPKLTPPLTLASIQIHAQLDSSGAANEVHAVSIAVFHSVNVESVIKPIPDELLTGVQTLSFNVSLPLDLETFCTNKGLRGVRRFPNEHQLLVWLASTLASVDADILIGHNFLGFTLHTLLRRYQDLNVSGWSTLGRLDLRRFPRLQGSSQAQERETCAGRLVADSYLLAREYFKSVNYKLDALAEEMHLRGIAKGTGFFQSNSTVLTPEILSSSENLFEIVLQLCNSAVLSAAVVLQLDALRLTKRLTTIAGNLWSRTLFGARSERIEYLLLHAFHTLKFITPDKKVMEFKRLRDDEDLEETKRKAKYQGGMVLEPQCGLYSDYVLLLDFNSLYPSLIQEFKICFTTVDRTHAEEDASIPPPENLICASCAAAGLASPCLHKCILPKVIRGLVESRRDVKRLMQTEKDSGALALLEIRQKALKLTANSMYGCLGFEHSRFYAQPLAELITRQGRLALRDTVDLIPKINPTLRVIYGDTDSVMIQTGIKDDIEVVRNMGYELRAKINKRYQCLEIDIDGVFRAILLLKKKKYASLSVVDWREEGKTYKKEVKGLDMVRRDWCPLSKKVSDAILNRILNAEGSEDILNYVMRYMQDISEHVRSGDRYTLEEFVISKSLTKEPECYRGNAFPHVAVALRMKQRKELVRVGDLIPYVICEGEKSKEKAYHVDEVQHNKSLHVDTEWYLTTQIYPPIVRLCEHIQGFSCTQLSQVMGIATHHFSHDDDEDAKKMNDDFSHCTMFKNRNLSECFPTAVQLQVQCVHCLCKTPIDPHRRVAEFLEQSSQSYELFDLYVCNNCGRSLPVDVVSNCFNQTCYTLFRQFYESGGGVKAVCALRTQLTYFRALFDIPHAPGCTQRVKMCHRSQARRCLGIDRNLYTLEEAEQPDVAERCDPVDSLHIAADTYYKRIDNLLVNLKQLFSK